MIKQFIKTLPGFHIAKALRHEILYPRIGLRAALIDCDEFCGGSTKDFLSAIDIAKIKFGRANKSLAAHLRAIKAFNLLVNKHEYLKFAVQKVGRPSGFMLDTVNACQLGCPSCQHTVNAKWAAMTYTPIPAGSLKPDTFDMLMSRVGLYAYTGHFYNNSEPFLNKRTPEYLRKANLFRIRTMISSNMSIPKLDAEAIVASGLDILMTAIDGTTQAIYERYRKGGKLELVFDNVRNIVAAKKRLGSNTPHLRWQFLTFEHNVHQIDDAIKMARALGYDSFNVATPYDVSMDDPSVKAVDHSLAGQMLYFTPNTKVFWSQELAPIETQISSAFRNSF
jgi:pyruvate-formate lyase-activating enzyme